MSCPRTQHGATGGDRTKDLSIRGPMLYHYDTALPNFREEFSMVEVSMTGADPGFLRGGSNVDKPLSFQMGCKFPLEPLSYFFLSFKCGNTERGNTSELKLL